MRIATMAAALALAQAGAVTAHPNMGKALAEIQARTYSTSASVNAGGGGAPHQGDSYEIIGDLATLPDSQLTSVGRSVKNIITGQESGQSSAKSPHRYAAKGSAACAKDTCCIWSYLATEMEKVFRGPSGRCTEMARTFIRLGFHDAAGWSKGTGPGGGADGSIVLAPEEMTRPANNGLQDAIRQVVAWHDEYKRYGVGVADLIQMGATVATVACPLGPRIRSFVGRVDSAAACTDGLLPSPFDSADNLIGMFENKTIGPHGLAALVGAHTTSQQDFVDPARAGDPQDSTPGVWDTLFYSQTLGRAPKRVFKFVSDIVLARDPRISAEWQAFAGPGGQKHWDADYAREYVRLSLLGVYNINGLTECTAVLPDARTGWSAPDQAAMNQWLGSTARYPGVTSSLRSGGSIAGAVGKLAHGVLGLVGREYTWRW